MKYLNTEKLGFRLVKLKIWLNELALLGDYVLDYVLLEIQKRKVDIFEKIKATMGVNEWQNGFVGAYASLLGM